MAGPTLFKFALDYEAADREGVEIFCATAWASNAETALADFMQRHVGTKGFVGVDEINPMPTHVRLEEDDSLAGMSEFDRTCALIRLAEQSGVSRTADVRAFLMELRERPKEISARLIREFHGEETGADLVRALAVAAE